MSDRVVKAEKVAGRKRGNTAQYSGKGNNSIQFWDRILRVKGDGHMMAFLAGCLLQDVESRVLTIIEEAEQPARTKKP